MDDPYAPPMASLGGGPDAIVVAVPDLTARIEVRLPSVWSGYQIFVDGQPAKKVGRKLRLTRRDGGEVEVSVRDALSGPVLVVGTQKYDVGPRVPAFVGFLCFLPLGLVAVGGLIGGLFGGLGFGLNRVVARSRLGVGAKVAVILAVTIGVGALAGAAVVAVTVAAGA